MIRFIPILAQTQYRNRLKGLRSAFNNKETESADVQSVVIFLAIIAAIIIVISIVHRLRQGSENRDGRATPGHPSRLFNQVMKKLGIGFADRVMMRFMVGQCSLEQPTVLFFSRDFFDRHAGQWLDSISVKPFQEYSRARVEAITELAFGTDDPPADPAGDQD